VRARGPRGLALALVATACAARGLPDQPVLREFAVPQRDFALGSGLRVLVQEDHNAPLVVVTSVFSVGGTADPPGREGLAHLVEHLVFRSVPDYDRRPVWDILQRTGATFNANTSADLTTYYAIAHRDRLPELLQLEAWRLLHTLDGVTEEAFKIERDVVQNELRQRRETSIGNRTFDELLVRLFPKGHPLGRPMAGTHESLAAITLDDARRFVAAHYRPETCSIVVAGDVRPDEVGKLLGRWPAQALFAPGGQSAPRVPHPLLAQSEPPPVPPPVSTALGHVKGPVGEPLLMLSWSTPGGRRGNDAVLRFIVASLDNSLASRVQREWHDDLLSFGASVIPLADASIVVVEARLRAGANPERARTRLLDGVGGAWLVGNNIGLVRRGAWGAATSLLRASADPVANGQAVAQSLATTGETAFYAASLQELARLTPGAVSDFAYRYLTRDRAVSVVFEPEDAGAPALAAPAAMTEAHQLGTGEAVNLSGLGPDEIRAVAHPPGLASLPRFRLQNGLEVVSVRRVGAPVAEIHLRIPGGDVTTSPYGLATLAVERSRPCLGEHGGLFGVGGSLAERNDLLSTRFTVRVLSGNLVNGLAVLADHVSCREVPDGPFLAMGETMKQSLERQRERDRRPQAQAVKALWSALYPRHPYGQVEPDWQALQDFSRSQAQSYVRDHFRPGGSLAVVVADVASPELQRMMEEYYSSWSGAGGGATSPAVTGAAPARSIQVFDRPGASQSTVTLGCRLEPVTAERLPAIDVLGAVLTERAWEIRREWGATYGIRASVGELPGAAHLIVAGAVETSHTGAAVEKLIGLITDVAAAGPDFKTFTLKRWDLARQYDQSFASPSAVAAALLRASRNGWPTDVWERYPERLAGTSRADVRAAIAPCAGHEVITVVGDAATVKAQLQERGLVAPVASARPPG
jgi:zinc protease